MLPTAIVPVRTGPTAKRRLAHVVEADGRHDLMRRLFSHVVSVLHESGLHVVALSPTPVDDAMGAEVWIDERTGLNAVIDHAVERTGTPALIVHADLPALHATDVYALLDEPGDVVIGRARDGGTNALLMRTCLRCAFGPMSAIAHASRARAMGLRARVVDRPGLALDVDDEASLIASSWPGSSSLLRPSSFPTPAP